MLAQLKVKAERQSGPQRRVNSPADRPAKLLNALDDAAIAGVDLQHVADFDERGNL